MQAMYQTLALEDELRPATVYIDEQKFTNKRSRVSSQS